MLNNPIILGTKLPALTNPGTAGDLLTGKQLIDQNGNVLTGTMPNRGAVSQALNAGQSYTVPAGYHNGLGVVSANSLAGQTVGTAVAADIAAGKTAWVNGVQVTGTATFGGINDIVQRFVDVTPSRTDTTLSITLPAQCIDENNHYYDLDLEDIVDLSIFSVFNQNAITNKGVNQWYITQIDLMYPFQSYSWLTVSAIYFESESSFGPVVGYPERRTSPNGTGGIGSVTISGRTVSFGTTTGSSGTGHFGNGIWSPSLLVKS